MIETPIITALNTSTYTAINIPNNFKLGRPCIPISAYTDDGSSWLIAVDGSGTGASTILALTPYNNSCVQGNITDDSADGTETIFYAKATAGTPNLILHRSQNPNR